MRQHLLPILLALLVLPTAASATPLAPDAPEAITGSADVPEGSGLADLVPAGLGLLALLAGLGLGNVDMSGNLGGYAQKVVQVRSGSHLGPTVTGKLAADVGKLDAGEVLGWDADGDDAELRPALLEDDAAGAGDGAATDFDFSFDSAIEPRTVEVTDGASTLMDDGSGRLYGDGSGTVNYATGEVSASFDAAPADGEAVTARAARELAGPLLRDADGATAGVVGVASHGTVSAEAVHVGGADVPRWLRRALLRRGIYLG